MVNSITKLKRYCETTLNVFLNKTIFDDDILYLYDKLFVSNRNYYLTCKNCLKFHVFPGVFFSKFLKFQVLWQPWKLYILNRWHILPTLIKISKFIKFKPDEKTCYWLQTELDYFVLGEFFLQCYPVCKPYLFHKRKA